MKKGNFQISSHLLIGIRCSGAPWCVGGSPKIGVDPLLWHHCSLINFDYPLYHWLDCTQAQVTQGFRRAQ